VRASVSTSAGSDYLQLNSLTNDKPFTVSGPIASDYLNSGAPTATRTYEPTNPDLWDSRVWNKTLDIHAGGRMARRIALEGSSVTLTLDAAELPAASFLTLVAVDRAGVTSAPAEIMLPEARAAGGRLVGLAVTSSKRAAALPDIPTIAEAGYSGYAADGWLGFLFPAGTPEPIVSRMFKEITAAMESAEVRSTLEKVGMTIDTSASPQAFHDVVRKDVVKWKKVVEEAKIERK